MSGPGPDSGEEESESGSGLAVEESKPKTQEPPKFAVILHNDDYTTMDFVVEVLRKYFHKTPQESVEITLRIHHQGQGLAGIYSLEIAETKAAQVNEYARSKGFPLKCTLEPA